jgi:hypothetical protein
MFPEIKTSHKNRIIIGDILLCGSCTVQIDFAVYRARL